MTDEQQQDEIIEQIKPTNSWYGLKKFAYSMLALLVVWIVFGQIMPMLMGFDKQEAVKPVVLSARINEQAAEKTIEIPEKIVAQPAPEITPEPTPEPIKIDDRKLQLLEEKLVQQETAINDLKSKLEIQSSQTQNQQIIVEKQVSNMLSAIIVFGQLKEAVLRGEPYNLQLNQLKILVDNNEQIEKTIAWLALKADTGITTITELNIQFAPLAKQVMIGKDDNYIGQILHKFITIRKVGERAGTSDEEVLARAEIRLQKGDLLSSLSELSELSVTAKEVFLDWSAKAQELLDARSNLDKLQLLITQKKQSEPALIP